MKLPEYKAKEVFKKHGIPVPEGVVVDFEDQLEDFEFSAAIKAQVPIGGRGKAGGIKFADNLDEARRKIGQIIGMDIHGYEVKRVLVEKMLNIEKELYMSVIIDRSNRMPLLIASAEGGMDIESVSEDKLYRRNIEPLIGVQPHILREMTKRMGLSGDIAKQVCAIAKKLYRTFQKEDAELVEINPLAITADGEVIAADGKMIIENDSLFRHPEYESLDEEELTPLERKAKEKGISFIQLEGDIGVIANGAGLTMATLDTLNHLGGSAGVFLDLGGTDNPDTVGEALMLMVEAKPKVIFLNIFGGITKCDTVAKGITRMVEKHGIEIPIVARIKGRNQDEAKAILKKDGIASRSIMSDAAEEAVKLLGGV